MALTDNTQGGATSSPYSLLPNAQSSFVFKEDVAAGAITVSLEDTDMPFGRSREVVAFESGGKVDIAQGGIYNPGSDRVVLQMMAVRENKLTIKGAFRDRIRAGAQRQQGGAEPNHARYMRDLVERVKRRGNPLKISWNGDERSGVLEEATYGEEGPHDITYAITFLIATPPTGVTSQAAGPTGPTPSIEDLRVQMQAALVAQQAIELSLLTNAAVTAGISNALTFMSSAMDALGTATTTLERSVLTSPTRQANAVISFAQAVQTQADNLRAAGLDSVRADQAMQNATTDQWNAWANWQMTTEAQLDQIIDAMRQIRLQSLQLLHKATRLYRVQVGDTLESVALTQLGSRARASDLGIRQDQLTAGAYVRIPQAR